MFDAATHTAGGGGFPRPNCQRFLKKKSPSYCLELTNSSESKSATGGISDYGHFEDYRMYQDICLRCIKKPFPERLQQS